MTAASSPCLACALQTIQVRSWIVSVLAAGGSVLVHCHEGKSRSVTLVASYLMAARGMSLADALEMIRCAPRGAL